MLNQVQLQQIPGRLFLSHMPGRYTPLAEDVHSIESEAVDYVVSLTGLDEIRRMAPDYAQAIENGTLPFPRHEFAVEDYGAPNNLDKFLSLANNIADDLKAGKHILIHCCVGIGRTGMLATAVLCRLGYDRDTALKQVEIAGSKPHTLVQYACVNWISSQ